MNSAELQKALALAESKDYATPMRCWHLMQGVLENSRIFSFAPFLDLESVQGLLTSMPAEYELIRTFAFGLWGDETPDLSPAMARKLKQLTLLTLASQKKVLEYPSLMSRLDVDTVMELESLIIDLIYAGMLKVQLNQRDGQVEIVSCMSRDLTKESLDVMILQLDTWITSTNQLMERLDQSVDTINSEFELNVKNKTQRSELLGQLSSEVSEMSRANPEITI